MIDRVVEHVCIPVRTTFKANRIRLDIPPNLGVVVPEPVVIEPDGEVALLGVGQAVVLAGTR